MKEKRKNCLNIGSVLSMPSSRILLGVAGVLAFATGSFAGTPALDSAREAAIVRYADQYIGHPYGKHVLKGIVFVESRYGRYKIGDGSFGIADRGPHGQIRRGQVRAQAPPVGRRRRGGARP